MSFLAVDVLIGSFNEANDHPRHEFQSLSRTVETITSPKRTAVSKPGHSKLVNKCQQSISSNRHNRPEAYLRKYTPPKKIEAPHKFHTAKRG